MSRNLDFRSEVAAPIYNKDIQQQLLQILEIQWSDNVKARIISADKTNYYRLTDSKQKHRSQDDIYTFLS